MPFGSGGLDRKAQFAAAGTGCSRLTVPLRSLDELARPCVLSIAFTASGSTYDLPKRPPKILCGCLRHRNVNTNILGRRNCRAKLPGAIRAGVGKRTPPNFSCDKVRD